MDEEKLKSYKLKKLKSEFSNYPVLICLLNYKYLKRQLRDLEIKNVYDVDFLLSDINLQNTICDTKYKFK